jgi:hypothetical protein
MLVACNQSIVVQSASVVLKLVLLIYKTHFIIVKVFTCMYEFNWKTSARSSTLSVVQWGSMVQELLLGMR